MRRATARRKSKETNITVSLNLDVKVGATEDAPDAQATLRVPVALQLFD